MKKLSKEAAERGRIIHLALRLQIVAAGHLWHPGWLKAKRKLLTARCAHNWTQEACSRNGGPYYCGACLNERRTADNRTYGS